MAIWPTFDYKNEPWKDRRTRFSGLFPNTMPGPEQRPSGIFPYGRPTEGFGAGGLDYLGQGGGRGYGQPPPYRPPGGQMGQPQDWTTEEWFPRLFELMQGRLAGGRRGMMNQMTSGLGQQLGRHLSRTNVPVPVGADALARRYMSPVTQAMEMQDPYNEMLQAMALAKMFAPGFGAAWGRETGQFRRSRDPMAYLEKYMDRFGGGL